MTMKRGMTAGGAVLVTMILASAVLAEKEGRPGRRGGHPEFRQFRQEQREARRAQFSAQRQENQSFRNTLKDKQPNEACAAVMDHRRQQFAENNSFMDKQHEATVQFMTEAMNEQEVSAEQQTQRLARMQERYQAMKSRHEERQAAVVARLQELSGKEDLTRDELRDAMQEFRPRAGKRTSQGAVERRRGRKRGQDREREGTQERRGRRRHKAGIEGV